MVRSWTRLCNLYTQIGPTSGKLGYSNAIAEVGVEKFDHSAILEKIVQIYHFFERDQSRRLAAFVEVSRATSLINRLLAVI